MIDKQRFKLASKAVILIIGIFGSLFLIKQVYSIFHTDASGVAANKIAFYVIEAKPQTQQIKIGEIAPDGQNYRYSVEINNFNNEKVSEVDMEYTMSIRTTTNIPVNYELYLGDSTTNIIGTKETIQDANGMYFFKFDSHAGSFVHGVEKTDRFTFVVNFPNTYNDAAYQDLIETIEITINAVQV